MAFLNRDWSTVQPLGARKDGGYREYGLLPAALNLMLQRITANNKFVGSYL